LEIIWVESMASMQDGNSCVALGMLKPGVHSSIFNYQA